MPHIELGNDQPGIIGLLSYRPETGRHLSRLAEELLRGPSSLSPGQRELIAAFVSAQNGCHFCFSSHGAAAAAHLGRDLDLLDEIRTGFGDGELDAKLRSLLRIAEQVARGGKHVDDASVTQARSVGATDMEIHDTVLIAAAFCMYNRYVDGLATSAPLDAEAYRATGQQLAENGYMGGEPERSSQG